MEGRDRQGLSFAHRGGMRKGGPYGFGGKRERQPWNSNLPINTRGFKGIARAIIHPGSVIDGKSAKTLATSPSRNKSNRCRRKRWSAKKEKRDDGGGRQG